VQFPSFSGDPPCNSGTLLSLPHTEGAVELLLMVPLTDLSVSNRNTDVSEVDTSRTHRLTSTPMPATSLNSTSTCNLKEQQETGKHYYHSSKIIIISSTYKNIFILFINF